MHANPAFPLAQPGLSPEPRKVIEVPKMGNIGNHMLQYMAALAIAERVPAVEFSHVELAEFGIQHPPIADATLVTETVQSPKIDRTRLAGALNSGRVNRVRLLTYAQQITNFMPAFAYRPIFKLQIVHADGPTPDELVCNIRQGEILDAVHPDYVLIPPAFYADLASRTGLRLVFIGQLEHSPYLNLLKKHFPTARYVPSRGAIPDLDFIRAAHNIVVPISTFGWVGAFLSNAKQIFLPVLGLLNPLQSRSTNLLPLNDDRYSFFHFPFHYAEPVAQIEAAQANLTWRPIAASGLASLLTKTPAPPHDIAPTLAVFDESAYLAMYPDIAASVAQGHIPSGRHHYQHMGFQEGRLPRPFDSAWYCRTNPDAAWDLAQGSHVEPIHHWVESKQFFFEKKNQKTFVPFGVSGARTVPEA